MKTCPVCEAVAFDDAVICYGCLHQFEPEGDEPSGETGGEAEALAEAPSVERRGLAPEFLIRFKPAASKNGDVTWSCAVETLAGKSA